LRQIRENERPGHPRKVPARRWGVNDALREALNPCQNLVFHRLYQTLPGDFIIRKRRIARIPRFAGNEIPEYFTPDIGWPAMDTSHLAEHIGAAGSVVASVFVVATYTMRTMIPLRIFGMLTNVILIATAIPSHNYLQLVLHGFLLPMNAYRLHQMLQLVRDVKKSVNSDLSMEWLKPFMTERKCATGEVLFYKDEKADSMLYIVSGRFRLVESGIEFPVGAIVGELGMLSPSNMRTQTLECIEAGVVLSVSYTQVEELYVQNPAFGFYFLRLSSARLFQNIDKLEQRLAEQSAAAAAAPA
jgi:hypothetical protein